LETGAGKTTEELLKHGFTQSDLHPCNISRTELNSILAKYPDVVVEHGNILHIFKEQQWLGVWFDLETSLLRTELPGQPWDHNRVPEFRRAAVCAISLSHRRVEGTTEQFAIELQSLMEKDVRYVTSPKWRARKVGAPTSRTWCSVSLTTLNAPARARACRANDPWRLGAAVASCYRRERTNRRASETRDAAYRTADASAATSYRVPT